VTMSIKTNKLSSWCDLDSRFPFCKFTVMDNFINEKTNEVG